MNTITLANGIRIATLANESPVATIGIFADAGSRWAGLSDGKSLTGASFLYQLLASSKNDAQTALGMEITTQNDRDVVSFTSTVRAKNASKALELLASQVVNPNISDESIATAKSTIQNLAKNYETNREQVAIDLLHETAYPDSTLGHSLIGKPEDLQALDIQVMSDFQKSHYNAPRIAVVVTGNINHDEIVSTVEKALGSLADSAPDGFEKAIQRPEATFIGSDLSIFSPNVESAVYAFGFEGVAKSSPDYVVTQVLKEMFGHYNSADGRGENMSQFLPRRLHRSDHHLKTMKPFNFSYAETGLIGSLVECPWDDIETTSLLFSAETQRFTRTNQFEEAEVRRAQQLVISKTAALFQTTSGATQKIGTDIITLGEPVSFDTLVSKVNNISSKDIARVSDSLFFDQDHVIGAMCPKIEGYYAASMVPDYNHLRAKSSSLRL